MKASPYTVVSTDLLFSTITPKLLHAVLTLPRIRVPVLPLRAANDHSFSSLIRALNSASQLPLVDKGPRTKDSLCSPTEAKELSLRKFAAPSSYSLVERSLELTFDLLSILPITSLLPTNITGLLFLGPSQTRRAFVSGVEKDETFSFRFKINWGILRDICPRSRIYIIFIAYRGTLFWYICLRLLYETFIYFKTIHRRSESQSLLITILYTIIFFI